MLKMKTWSFHIILYYLLVVRIDQVLSSILQTVIINPWNPMFSCALPTINVRVADFINFACPSTLNNYFINNGNNVRNEFYESLYYLEDDVVAFNQCNATGAKQLLRCDDPNKSVFDLVIRDIVFPDAIIMQKGRSYYFIDTAYRTIDNVNNLINGSCSSAPEGQYKIRFKFYLCTDDDINNGRCEQCISEGCYYKDCSKTCSAWNSISESLVEQTILQSRQCQNTLLNQNTTEYQNIPAPPLNCTSWLLEHSLNNGGNCTSIVKRFCTTYLGKTVAQYKEMQEACQQQLIDSAQTSEKNDRTDIYKIILIVVSIGLFILGMLCGIILHRFTRRKSTIVTTIGIKCQDINSNGCDEIVGVNNQSYDYDNVDGIKSCKQLEEGIS